MRAKLTADAKSALISSVGPAYNNLITYITELEKKAPTEGNASSLPNGMEFYNTRLKHHTSTDLNAEEIHKIGLSEVKRIQHEMRSIMGAVDFRGDLQAFFKFIQKTVANNAIKIIVPSLYLKKIISNWGIKKDKIDKIFQVYYSTKKTGTGLGLPAAKRIIEENKGTISIRSEDGKGSSFLIKLPVNGKSREK